MILDQTIMTGDGHLTRSVRPFLSKRQEEILKAAALGESDKLIAEKLQVSTRTLEGHWRAIHRKLGSLNRCHTVLRDNNCRRFKPVLRIKSCRNWQ